MYFTTSLISLLAVAGVHGLPGSNLEARQAGELTIAWYANSQCRGTPLSTDTVREVDGACFGGRAGRRHQVSRRA
ncbi:hypothetical protein SCUP234_05629 [Seiridium cupressi]